MSPFSSLSPALLSFGVFIAFGLPCAASAAESKVLLVGQSLRLLGVGEIQAEKSDALKISSGPDGIRILGIKPGSAEIQTAKGRLLVSVLNSRQKRSFDFLSSWAAKNPGLQVEIEKGEVFLQGRLFAAESWIQIARRCGYCSYAARFEITPDRQEEMKTALHDFLREHALPRPSLRWSPRLAWSIAKSTKDSALRSMGERLGISVEDDDSSLEIAPMIRTQIFVMEVRREFTRTYGLSWPQSVSAQVLPGQIAQFGPMGFSAHALENEGLGRVLASPTLLCRSGQEAEFLAGGEFPIKVLGYHAQDVVWKKYGIMLKVKPRADRWGRMSITIETEISSIDKSRTVDGLPGLFTNRVSSHFDLEKSATIAISGLIKNEEAKNQQGLPGLSGVPVLGALFGSKDFTENRTELVIFVRPEVIDLKAGP